MQHLWAPWRMAYILAGEEHSGECILCAFPARGPEHRREHLILVDTGTVFVMLNKFPYNNGHLMVAPRRHAADPDGLPDDEYQAVAEMVRRATAALREAMSPHGFNIGMNLGRVAGAGIDTHCHWHIVPRWNGDTNFMPVVAEVKVMGEHLLGTYDRLAPHFAKLYSGPLPEGQGGSPGPLPEGQGGSPGPLPEGQGGSPGPLPEGQGGSPGPLPEGQGGSQ